MTGVGLGQQRAPGMQGSGSQSPSGRRGNGRTGPAEGIGVGQRGRGTRERTTFKREKVGARQLDPRGMIIGKMDVQGPTPRGDVKFQAPKALQQAAQALTEEMEKEPLPPEHRRQVEKYYDLLRQLDSEE